MFNEKSDVLILATHRITTDLQSKNIYVIATALASLSEICTADMCRGVLFKYFLIEIFLRFLMMLQYWF